MNFTSLYFWIFLLVCLAVYWLGRGKAWQNVVLLTASLVFYASFHLNYVILLVASILADYLIALRIQKQEVPKKKWLWLGLALNIGVWAFFKYAPPLYDFFIRFDQADYPPDLVRSLSIWMPIGLSFITLKKIAYLLEVYRGRLTPQPGLLEYACYISFFPQMMSGPIDRPQRLIPQLQVIRHWNNRFLLDAWPLILTGLFKKMVIANGIGVIVNQVYLSRTPSKLLWLIGTLGFAVQVLADFSGYTDISRGVARLLGFETPVNFNAPYLALNLNDFWNRWHITLSSWLRDYIFFPLRRWLMQQKKNRPAWLADVIPPLATMLVSGIWHGTGWNYLVWGLFHGVLLAVPQLLAKPSRMANPSLGKRISSWMFTIVLLLFSWAIFRATSLPWLAGVLFHSPWISGRADLSICLSSLSFVVFYLGLYLLEFIIHRWTRQTMWVRSAFYAAITLLIFIYSNSVSPDFIYTHF